MISVKRLSWRQWEDFSPDWERIHDGSPEASFFLSREWVGFWLEKFGEQLNPDLMIFVRESTVVGCCLLVWRTQFVRGIPLRRVYLNCAGEDEADSTCIEYNSILSFPDFQEIVAKALGEYLQKRFWDEFIINGIVDDSPLLSVITRIGNNEVSVKPSYFVDLSRVRVDAGGFSSFLSSNTRQQIRRAERLYEQVYGACSLRFPKTVPEALEIFEQLVELHQTAWRERGRSGVFGSVRFSEFHKRLIGELFEYGRVMIIEASAGTDVFGVLYGFIDRGRIYFYQSGFRYETDRRMKPGLLMHYMVIRHYSEAGELREYDFLAGDSQYKRSLATSSRLLRWVVTRRLTLGTAVFRTLRWIKRAYDKFHKKSFCKD